MAEGYAEPQRELTVLTFLPSGKEFGSRSAKRLTSRRTPAEMNP
jgi:hypothetical protein